MCQLVDQAKVMSYGRHKGFTTNVLILRSLKMFRLAMNHNVFAKALASHSQSVCLAPAERLHRACNVFVLCLQSNFYRAGKGYVLSA